MGVIIGVVVGYAFGTRAGPEGWDELRQAWKVIATSEEVRDLIAGGFSMAREVLGRGTEVVREVLAETNGRGALRPVA
jgi:hypothetical protein